MIILGIINGFIFGALVGVVMIMSLYWNGIKRGMLRDIERYERVKMEYQEMQRKDNDPEK